MIDYGKIAYDAYGENRGWVVFNGDPMPMWDEQSDELRTAWRAAAAAVALQVRVDALRTCRATG